MNRTVGGSSSNVAFDVLQNSIMHHIRKDF